MAVLIMNRGFFMEQWHGYELERFLFEDREALVVFPESEKARGLLAVKTEYWNAFPEAAELGLLENGFHLCFIKNENRWGTSGDIDPKSQFIRHVQEKYSLANKCTLIGMSCGGLIAIKLAANYPELVSCMYLDAPVVNYMSCPCGFGIGKPLEDDNFEILDALGLKSISQLLAYRDMPLDNIPKLVAANIPVVMVSGDSDHIVPYCENGALLQDAYEDTGVRLEVYIKQGGDHHPHGLENPSSIIRFILQNGVTD